MSIDPQLSLRTQDMDHFTHLCLAKHDLNNDAATLSGLWLMRIHSPEWYNGLNGSAVANAIFDRYSPAVQAGSRSPSRCENSLAILDMWWFAAAPGGFEVLGKKPDTAWLSCLHRKLRSFAHQPAAALKKQPAIDVVQQYIQALELEQLQHGIQDVQRMVRQLFSQAETYFFADGGQRCVANQKMCGYYLTHFVLRLSKLHASKATGTLAQRKLVKERIHQFIAPYFKGSTRADMDLLNELLFVYPDIVYDPRNDEAFSGLAALWKKRSAVPTNCHMAVTNAFAAGIMHRFAM